MTIWGKNICICFLFAITISAQENVFLQRDFWKKNPSIAEIEAAIAAGNDVAELNSHMFDAVSYALIEKVDNATIKHLMEKPGNGVDKLTHDGRTYIFWAAYRNNLEIMDWLVQRGAKANMEDAHGYSVLNFAAVTGQTNPQLYDFLLEHEADIHATDHHGANALLMVASHAKDLEILKYFEDKGLSLESVDDHGKGIFQYAVKGGHIPLLQKLVAMGADYLATAADGENALNMAAQGTRGNHNGKAVFEYLESLGLKPTTTKQGKNLLHDVSKRNKDIALFHYLLGQGMDVDAQDSDGMTPLMNAAKGNTPEVVHVLGEKANGINRQDKKGRSALTHAVSQNTPEVVEYLLSKGADISVTDKKGNTLAYYVVQAYDFKNPESFETKLTQLRDVGLDMKEDQHHGNSLLHIAAKDANLHLLKRLEALGMDVNKKNHEGNTPLHLAAMSTRNTEVLKYLLDRGADVSLKTDFGETVFDLASENELLDEPTTQLDFLK